MYLCQPPFFEERLTLLRNQKETTQKEIVETVNISPVSIQRFEYGTVRSSLEKLIALADSFDVSLDYLVDRSENPRGIELNGIMLSQPLERGKQCIAIPNEIAEDQLVNINDMFVVRVVNIGNQGDVYK